MEVELKNKSGELWKMPEELEKQEGEIKHFECPSLIVYINCGHVMVNKFLLMGRGISFAPKINQGRCPNCQSNEARILKENQIKFDEIEKEWNKDA